MVNYRKVNEQDLWQIANIHKEQFPDHYLGKFSVSLLYKFYKNLYEGDFIFLVAEDNQKVVGFVLGGDLQLILGKLNDFIKKYASFYMLEIIVRPNTWKDSALKFWSRFIKSHTGEYNLDDIEKYTILSIATAKAMQGQGLGGGLVKAFEKELLPFGNRYMISVRESNNNAIKFYEKNGFVVENKLRDEFQMVKIIK